LSPIRPALISLSLGGYTNVLEDKVKLAFKNIGELGAQEWQ